MMLNRRHIRVKVMQTMYAFKGSESDDFSKDQKFLLFSIDNMYNLYLLLVSLLIEVQKRAESDLKKKQNKHLATKEDKDPNRKFVNNRVLNLLRENLPLADQLKAHNINNWDLDGEYVDLIFKDILASDLYKAYMQTRVSDFKEDKNFIVDVFKDIIAPNEKLYDYMEDKNLTWLDDLPTVNTTILKLLRKVKETSAENHFTPKLYKDIEDKQFAIDLFKKTLLKSTAINKEIDQKTKNWDTDRIATVDFVLLQMAICELNNFPSIPVKVTINEYLEISKEYSTPKSSIFINGILDKLVKEYEASGELNKIGRGLM
ncbi:transcription antitermination factor NusB [Algibacter amylolyticus]|uniref:Transcription antitermination factor NusB n=1 Tax=Algibacter amylolyticus TaxID=1608400 RepID=A0A5M7B4U5_9FLAO|nr:transcription antitermination factor NusB [Algibacter amylolyticus]KAA5823407.1 transcription antitermination factor NusB [Algibacter amylolyticus]MBB5267557.1 N utilization substance protein B [Algibacter amylolyticus]TSJ73895.1 transcription antitermination factor NusB [Algibacter amylolyticus]